MIIPDRPESASDDYSPAEWEQLYGMCFRASSRILTLLEQEIGREVEGAGLQVNPQAAGVALLLCMGRLQGRYGFRHIGARKAWEGWISADLRPLFETAFRGERAAED